ncbi:MAG: TonB family protein [Hyphomonadaceae bacterium]
MIGLRTCLYSLCALALGASAAAAQDVQWISHPSQQDMAAFYPEGARARGLEGRASLSCAVRPDTTFDCAVNNETPVDEGFGHAALRMSQEWRAQPPADGQPVNLAIRFALPPAPQTASLPAFEEPISAARYAEAYPYDAARQGVSGHVELGCEVRSDRRLRCAVSRETPGGWLFGDAALQLSRHLRVARNQPAYDEGARFTLPIDFSLN